MKSETINLEQLISLYQKQTEITNYMWTFFLVLVAAIGGAALAGGGNQLSDLERFLVAIGFLLFSGANLWFLLQHQRLVLALKEAIYEKSKKAEINPALRGVLSCLSGAKRRVVILFHLVFDLVVLSIVVHPLFENWPE